MMHQKLITNTIVLLFMTAFLIPRIAGVHAIAHFSGDDEEITCEFCDTITFTNQFDLSSADGFTGLLELQIAPSSFVVIKNYNEPLAKISSPIAIHNKPPPSI